jgi:ComF family protein
MLDRVIAATALAPTTERFIYALKYRGVQGLATPLADRLCALICLRPETRTMFGENPLVVPVPLHRSRMRERGYNQAHLFAERIAQTAAMPLEADVLVRIRATHQQVKTTGRAARRENMHGAFSVVDSGPIRDRDVVLIDDVTTTGATLDDCARALREAGARSVSALTFARG